MGLVLNSLTLILFLVSGSGPDLGLLVRGGQRQEPDQRQRGVRGDRPRDEPQELLQRPGNHLHLLRHLVVGDDDDGHGNRFFPEKN